MYRDLTNKPHNCSDCIHNGKQYFDEPCEDCTPNHCAYEALSPCADANKKEKPLDNDMLRPGTAGH